MWFMPPEIILLKFISPDQYCDPGRLKVVLLLTHFRCSTYFRLLFFLRYFKSAYTAKWTVASQSKSHSTCRSFEQVRLVKRGSVLVRCTGQDCILPKSLSPVLGDLNWISYMFYTCIVHSIWCAFSQGKFSAHVLYCHAKSITLSPEVYPLQMEKPQCYFR